jgi:hypothetical protein
MELPEADYLPDLQAAATLHRHALGCQGGVNGNFGWLAGDEAGEDEEQGKKFSFHNCKYLIDAKWAVSRKGSQSGRFPAKVRRGFAKVRKVALVFWLLDGTQRLPSRPLSMIIHAI